MYAIIELLSVDIYLAALFCILFQVTPMLREHNWIQLEQQYFGMPNTAYNFRTNNPEKPASG